MFRTTLVSATLLLVASAFLVSSGAVPSTAGDDSETRGQLDQLVKNIDQGAFYAAQSATAKFNLVAKAINDVALMVVSTATASKFARGSGLKLAQACSLVGPKLSQSSSNEKFILDVCELVPKTDSIENLFDLNELPQVGSAKMLRELGANMGFNDKNVQTGQGVWVQRANASKALDKSIESLGQLSQEEDADVVFGGLANECAKYMPFRWIFTIRQLGYELGSDERVFEGLWATRACWPLNFYKFDALRDTFDIDLARKFTFEVLLKLSEKVGIEASGPVSVKPNELESQLNKSIEELGEKYYGKNVARATEKAMSGLRRVCSGVRDEHVKLFRRISSDDQIKKLRACVVLNAFAML